MQRNDKTFTLNNASTLEMIGGETLKLGPKLKNALKIPLILMCFAVPIAAWIWYGEGGMVHLRRSEVERQACLERIRKLAAENQALIEEVHRFRTDMKHVESFARNELNLIRENEVIYRLGKERLGKGRPGNSIPGNQ